MTPFEPTLFKQIIAILQAEADEGESRAPMFREMANSLLEELNQVTPKPTED